MMNSAKKVIPYIILLGLSKIQNKHEQENYESNYKQNELISEPSNSGSNISEEKQILTEENRDLITIENADFSNKKNMINSPRSLKACKELGIIPIELYQISIEEYKSQNPSLFALDQKMLQFRYKGYEKFRKDSISLVKNRREILISRENNGKNKIRRINTENNFIYRSLEKMKEGERKYMENLKKQQKKNIKNILEEQINKEILKKVEQKKEWRQQKREEIINKEKKEKEISKKKAEDELNERKKKIEEENKKKEEIFLQKLKEELELEEEMKKKNQLDYDYKQRKLFEDNEKFQKK